MLLAEINGKRLEEARNNEDYLTSTVFGQLRYLPPKPFWETLFHFAKGMPSSDGTELKLDEVLVQRNQIVNSSTTVRTYFWCNHPALGEPDVVLYFSDGGLKPFAVVVEAKLWSEKHGKGEYDQLVRYSKILNDLSALKCGIPQEATGLLIYLTPRDSIAEIEESLALSNNPEKIRPLMFRLQWQDMVLACQECRGSTSEITRTVCGEVADFLRRLNHEYFENFEVPDFCPDIEPEEGQFWTRKG